MKNKFPTGIVLFGLYFVADSLRQLFYKLSLPGYYSWYSGLFHPSSEHAIFLRYIFSVMYRVFELVSGTGILLRKESIRKFTLFFSWFTIGIVYWKHPFLAVERFSKTTIDGLYFKSDLHVLTQISLVNFTWIVLMGLYAIDLGVAIAAIYYFTRPYIKECFGERTGGS